MGKRNKVTTRDIAEYTQLSQATVSMILSDKANVSFKEETIRQVKDAAKTLNYKPPKKVAKKTDKKLLDTLAVICPNVTNAYYSMVLSSITKQAKKYHYHIFCLSTLRENELEKAYLHYLKNMKPDGIIFLYPPALDNIPLINSISKIISVVEIGDQPDGLTFDSISLNSIKSGKLVGQHLFEQGHRKIAYISSPISAREIGRNDRYEGLKQAFIGVDAACDLYTSNLDEFMQLPIENQEYANGYQLCKKILKENAGYTAFVGNNDMTAIGILAAIKDEGYHVPRDLAVCGFDNIPLASSSLINLTTIEHASCDKGAEAVDLIFNKQKSKAKQKKTIRMEYEPTLIIRRSSKKIVK